MRIRSLAAIGVLVLALLPAIPAAFQSPAPVRSATADVTAWRAGGLAAFDTVWRTIHDTYFDPSLGGLDWDAVRRELRPRVAAAQTAGEQRALIREMLRRLGQSHFALLSDADRRIGPRGPALPPFEVRLAGQHLLVTRVSSRTLDVRAGDRILAIDNHPLTDLLSSIGEDDPHRPEQAWRLATRELSGASGTRVRLQLEAPDGVLRDVVATRVVPPGEVVTVGNLPPLRAYLAREERRTSDGRRIGIIRFNVWMAAVAAPFAEAIDAYRDADGLILDLRGNPGGLAEMMRGLAGHLFDEPALIGRMRMRDLELEFRANPRRSTVDGRAVEPYAGPVAILVDELTASASECFAGGLQALGRARIFGRRTAGQALPAATQQLINGDVLLYAVGDFVTSNGRRLEGTGVRPDVEVPLDPAGLASGRDAEAIAIEWLTSGQP